MDTDMRHVPVALERVLELLAPVLDTDSGRHPVLVDATTGLGGHSQAVLTRFPAARVIGLDREARAIDPGTVAPEIQSTDWLNGDATSLADLRGKVVLIEFWAHW